MQYIYIYIYLFTVRFHSVESYKCPLLLQYETAKFGSTVDDGSKIVVGRGKMCK